MWAPDVTGPNRYVEFRRALELGGDAVEAWLQVSAETSLRVTVNGVEIHRGPPREVPPYFYHDTLDLRPHLRPGRNELHILAHHQGANSQSYQAGTPAVLVAGRCACADGNDTDLSRPCGLERPGGRALSARRPSSVFLPWLFRARRPHRRGSALGPAHAVARHPWDERPVALPGDLPVFHDGIREARAIVPAADGWLIDMGGEVSGFILLALEAPRKLSARISYAEALTDGRVDPCKAGMNYSDRLVLPAASPSGAATRSGLSGISTSTNPCACCARR